MLLVELGSGRSDDQDRDALGAIRQMLQKAEHRLVRPMQILEHEHRRPLLGDQLQPSPPRREQLFPLCRRGRLDSQQRQQSLAKPGSLLALGQHHLQLRGDGDRIVRFEDPRVGLHDLPERPECDPLAIRQRPPLPPGHQTRPCVDVGAQLGHDPALAKAGLAHHRHQLQRVRGDRLLEDALQQREINLPANKG